MTRSLNVRTHARMKRTKGRMHSTSDSLPFYVCNTFFFFERSNLRRTLKKKTTNISQFRIFQTRRQKFMQLIIYIRQWCNKGGVMEGFRIPIGISSMLDFTLQLACNSQYITIDCIAVYFPSLNVL